jgi:hypothetical protein
MPEQNNKEFYRAKDQVKEAFETLLVRVDDCEELGLIDTGSALYNQILSIMDEVDLAKSFEELDEAIALGRDIEHNLDAFMLRQGMNTIDLDWPDLEPFLES